MKLLTQPEARAITEALDLPLDDDQDTYKGISPTLRAGANKLFMFAVQAGNVDRQRTLLVRLHHMIHNTPEFEAMIKQYITELCDIEGVDPTHDLGLASKDEHSNG